MKETTFVMESTATPLDTNIFYWKMVEEAAKVDQLPRDPFMYSPPVWKDVTEFNATGFPDFLPGSEK